MLKIINILSGFLFSTFLFVAVTNAQTITICAANDYSCQSSYSNSNSSYGNSYGNPYTTYGQNQYVTQQAPQLQVGDKYPDFCPLLRRSMASGDTGQDVKRLQVVLGQEGIAYLGATGYFGPATKNAVKVFQLRNGIRQTGAVGPQTLARMRALWCLGQSTTRGTNTNTNIYGNGSGYGGGGYTSGNTDVTIVPQSSSGNSVMIAWTSTNANYCTLNGQQIQPNGQQVFPISAETTFSITCRGYNSGDITKTIIVKPNQSYTNLPTVNLSINPSTALVNTTATLYWTSVNSYTCDLNGQQVPPTGSQQIYVTSSSATYRITCASQTGQSVSATAYTNGSASVPTDITIWANPGIITSGQSSTLSWSASGASYCMISNNSSGTGDRGNSSGSIVVNPTVTTTYYLTCTGSNGGSSTNQVTVNVGNGNNANNGVTLVTNTDKTNYNIGETMTVTSTVTNNTGSTYNFNNYSCDPLTTRIDSLNPRNLFSDSSLLTYLTCDPIAPGYEVVTLANGQSRTFTSTFVIKAYANGVASAGNHTISTSIPGTPIISQKTFTVAGNSNSGNITVTTTANPTNITTSNQAVTITWSSTNATYCNIFPGAGASILNQTTSGTVTSNSVFNSGTNYGVSSISVVCYNSLNQSNTANTTVNLNNSNNSNITSTVTANLTNVSSGQATTLTWSSTNANYCNISGGATNINNQATSGNYVVYPTVTTTYSVTCFNSNGQSGNPAQVIVYVNGTSSNISASITANYSSVTSGQPIVLTWTSTNTSYCNITANNSSIYSNQPSNGTLTVSPSISTNYQLNCYNNNNQNTAAYVYVTVNGSSTSGVPTATIYASTQNVSSGQSITLNWYSSNATTCTLSSNGNTVITNQSPSGSYLVYPTTSTNYQITCTNNSNGQSASGYVYVTVNGTNTGAISVVSRQNGFVVISTSYCNVSGYIDWGDSTRSNLNGGSCSATYSHQYSNNNGQSYLVRILDQNNSPLTSTTIYPY